MKYIKAIFINLVCHKSSRLTFKGFSSSILEVKLIGKLRIYMNVFSSALGSVDINSLFFVHADLRNTCLFNMYSISLISSKLGVKTFEDLLEFVETSFKTKKVSDWESTVFTGKRLGNKLVVCSKKQSLLNVESVSFLWDMVSKALDLKKNLSESKCPCFYMRGSIDQVVKSVL